MKKAMLKIFILSICLFIKKVNAQNLVPNYSFEIYNTCPTSFAQVYKAFPWIDPTGRSSDYFNACTSDPDLSVPSNAGGYQLAHTGNAYMGLGVFSNPTFKTREYIQVKLSDSLKAGVLYRVTFFVSPAEVEKFTCDQVGAFFSDTAIIYTDSNWVLNYNPQVSNPAGNIITDTLNWTEITGTFTAVGGEKYLTIGNFKDDANTQFAVINSASTYEGAYFYIDDVSVYPDSVTGVNELKWGNEFKIYPNPNDGNMTVEYSILEDAELQVFDVSGRLISKYFLNKENTTFQFSNNALRNGIYYCKIISNNKYLYTTKLVIVK